MKKKILVVDDEKSIRELVVLMLRKAGYEVYEAKDGREALESLYEVSPDMVILDALMPRMSGFEACGEIRKNPMFKNVLIFMLTVKSAKQDQLEGYNCGADEYMVKTPDIREVVARVKLVFERTGPK